MLDKFPSPCHNTSVFSLFSDFKLFHENFLLKAKLPLVPPFLGAFLCLLYLYNTHLLLHLHTNTGTLLTYQNKRNKSCLPNLQNKMSQD
nr:MAG TPA: hypothetical protein [Caudoviricetes sp.]